MAFLDPPRRSCLERTRSRGLGGHEIHAARTHEPARGLALAPEAAASVLGRAAEPPLSEREVEVVRLLAQGHSNRAIGGALSLAEATVKTHLVCIYRRFSAENRAAAVSEAVRLGLV
ncbi:LuxR C-terminal-related transcriptional regulator [Streptomyces griseoruber]|uniref:LuxR C-terminal-related transcriptional regulator n=1 Tax=Streptomyces griseoruber TaxID=1943 RepID=UPI003793F9D2